MVALRVGDHSLRTADAFPVVASLPPKKKEATTGNASAVHRLRRPRNKRNVGSCWLKSLTGLIQTLRNNSQQNATGCANGRNMYHVTIMLRLFARGLNKES